MILLVKFHSKRSRFSSIIVRNYFKNQAARPMGAGRPLFARRKNGFRFPLEIGFAPLNNASENYTLVSLIDISKYKFAEKRFKLMILAAPYYTVMLDDHHKTILVNPKTQEYFGYESKELMGKTIEKIVPELFLDKSIEGEFDSNMTPLFYEIKLTKQLGANCYITKPIDLISFQSIVKSIKNFWFTVVKLPRYQLA